MKAKRIKVFLGMTEIEVLMSDSHELFVEVLQLINLTQDNDTIGILSALNEKSTFSVKTGENSELVTAVPIKGVADVLLRCAVKGDNKALTTLKMLLNLSLTQVAYDSLEVRFSTTERANFIRDYPYVNATAKRVCLAGLRIEVLYNKDGVLGLPVFQLNRLLGNFEMDSFQSLENKLPDNQLTTRRWVVGNRVVSTFLVSDVEYILDGLISLGDKEALAIMDSFGGETLTEICQSETD